jgi:hypothetical protein
MEIIESVMWFSIGLLPTLAILEGIWRLSRTPAVKVPVLMEGRREVNLAHA